jgi:hypothetical protein
MAVLFLGGKCRSFWGMIGYDVGARVLPEEEPTGLFGGTDVALPAVESMMDDVVALSGKLRHVVPDATDDVSELIGVLGDAAEVAGKMHVGGGVSGGSSTEAASNDTMPLPKNPEQSALWDSRSAILAAQLAGSVMAGAAVGKIAPIDLDHGDPSVPDAAVKVKEDAAGLDGLDQTYDFGQRNAQLDSILRQAKSLDFSNESNSDGRVGGNPLAKVDDLYANSIPDLGEGIESGDASVSGALTGSGLTRWDEAGDEHGAMLEQNDERMFGSGYGIKQASSKGEADALHDSIENEKFPTDLADFSGPEGEFCPFIREGLSGDGIQDSAVHDISRRAADRPQLGGVGITGAGTVMSAPSSDGDETPSVKRMPDFSGLWEMLRDAERILPKPSFADTADDRQAAANEIETRPSHSLDMLNKLVAAGLANHRQKDDSSMPDERVAPAGGKSGPTGHRNDPIYTVAISSMTGTLMPLVPTPGTSTRSPPIPGQRNLP